MDPHGRPRILGPLSLVETIEEMMAGVRIEIPDSLHRQFDGPDVYQQSWLTLTTQLHELRTLPCAPLEQWVRRVVRRPYAHMLRKELALKRLAASPELLAWKYRAKGGPRPNRPRPAPRPARTRCTPEDLDRIASPEPGPLEVLLAKEQGELLRAGMRCLSVRQRDALRAHFFNDASYARAADKFDCTPETVHDRVYQSIARLRNVLPRNLAVT